MFSVHLPVMPDDMGQLPDPSHQAAKICCKQWEYSCMIHVNFSFQRVWRKKTAPKDVLYHNIYKSDRGSVFPAVSLENVALTLMHDEKTINRDRELK